MAKGQMRSNKEARKPKKDKSVPVTVAPPVRRLSLQPLPGRRNNGTAGWA
jgi:hypothetical protein